jgi:tRNA1Val (adenine37-N6)-methyltransferase
MSDSTFRFKQFTVHQDKCAMKVGTDAVLLGSWVEPSSSKLILDIGTGTGIIALMLAQKSSAFIDAIDIDEGAYKQARENILISPWFKRMNVICDSFQNFSNSVEMKYDLVVSNPPYFHHASKPPEEARLTARHDELLTFDELIDGVKKILSPDGSFCLILPLKEGHEFMGISLRKGLFCRQLVRVKTIAGKEEKRLLLEFSFHFGVIKESEIILRQDDTSFSEDYIELTKEFYIGLK